MKTQLQWNCNQLLLKLYSTPDQTLIKPQPDLNQNRKQILAQSYSNPILTLTKLYSNPKQILT